MPELRIETDIQKLRDPFVLREGNVYYMYGTEWRCLCNRTGDLSRGWTDDHICAEIPPDAETNHWAPEVHKHRGSYYMFTTYRSAVRGRNGCTVFRSESPEGPFRPHSDGLVTPEDWDAIDGTLYIDSAQQPWMVFVHEWVSTDDGVGRMAAARLSDDLTRLISEPVELFRADDPAWAKHSDGNCGFVTDGPFLYRTRDGGLLMIWSNWDDAGYCVGIAHSSNGNIDGAWTQEETPLYSKNTFGDFEGGHGMLFEAADGTLYLSIHAPNGIESGRLEKPTFIRLREQNGTLVVDRD